MDQSGKSSGNRNSRRRLGRRGEALAAEYLHARGYQILECNYRTAYGEIDLIALQPAALVGSEGQVLVFVEVKTRSSNAYGYPEEAVTASKQTHLIQSAQAYLQAHPEQAGDWRIDVIAIRMGRLPGKVEIKLFENAVH